MNTTTTTKANTPKWIGKLTNKQVKALLDCNNGNRVTLAQLIRDVEFQKESGVVCWSCRDALYTIHPNHTALNPGKLTSDEMIAQFRSQGAYDK